MNIRIDSLAVSVRDIRQGGNLQMHTYIVDMFVLGRSEGFVGESGLHQVLVVLTTERKVPTVRQGDGNVVVKEKRP